MLWETDTFPSITAYHDHSDEIIIGATQCSLLNHTFPGSSVSQSTVWKTLCNKLYSYHNQQVKNLQPRDPTLCWQYCTWLNMNCQLHGFILFTEEAQFTWNDTNNFRIKHTWAKVKPHTTVQHNFQQWFSINVWYDLVYHQLNGPFILPRTSKFQHLFGIP